MADIAQTLASGGGEGTQLADPASIAAEAKTDAQPAEKPEESKPQEAKETEAPKDVNSEAKEPAVNAQTEQKDSKPEESKDIKPEAPKEAKAKDPIEAKPEAPTEAKPEATIKVKQDAPVVESKATEATQSTSNGVAGNTSNGQGDWQQRESDLLKKIEELEKVKTARAQESILLELKVREEEIDLLKSRVKNLETELQAALSKPSGKNHEMIENIKRQHEELLSKARGMIFDKTKMVKNQELQIEALTTQIQSLKDINLITKDLLEIRNSECKAMEDRLQAMEARFAVEKERYGLVLQRAQASSNINDGLRTEYETQLKLFKELREKYDQRVQALVAENERLKASLKPAGEAAPGTSG